ncbi:Endonuclease/exonuclease/phosphatase [Phascolomyces articulosus]|uniref:Endonuclease/exonuclease/phosphatase n=1 Tax=Phascolomyces articulosus TaxID=60185 RepID=A0AAD5KFY0_9FUNG|nr:Endonuclease/exonuclease/phosphatase [Phascolomyces articulosus]
MQKSSFHPFFLFLFLFSLFYFDLYPPTTTAEKFINKEYNTMKFMTFNIRLDLGGEAYASAPPLPIKFQGELPWSVRKWKVGDTVLMWEPDIEPLYHQVMDLDAMLCDEYAWVGAGRGDGQKQGEFTPVFYKKKVLKVEEWQTVWLSEEPDKPGSVGWDAKHPRIATVITFSRLSDGSRFHVYNAHFDHEGPESRKGAAQVILNHAREKKELTILMGDFNSPEADGGYVTLTGGQSYEDNSLWRNIDELNQKTQLKVATMTGSPVRTTEGMTLPTHRVIRPGQILQNLHQHQQEQNVFVDTRYALETVLTNQNARGSTMSGPYGDVNTFTSFGEPNVVAPVRLDYIMMMHHHPDSTTVRRFGVLSNMFDDQLLISDHRPVVAVIDWY